MKSLKSLKSFFKNIDWGHLFFYIPSISNKNGHFYRWNIFGWRNFYDIDQLEIFLTKKYIIYDTFGTMKSFLLFKTRRQHTWLVKTDENIYCILDDVTKSNPVVRWDILIDSLLDKDGKLIKKISVTPYRSDSDSGIVDFGHKKSRNPNDGWYYTKSLHTDPKKLKKDLTEFITN